jgi:hypothetical protein
MSEFICSICNQSFKNKNNLIKHQNKKNKCNIETEFKCSSCNKFFKQKRSLITHQIKCNKTDNIIKIDDNNKIFLAIKAALQLNEDDDTKILFLQKYDIKLSTEELKIILKTKSPIDEKINLIYPLVDKNILNSNVNNGIINSGTIENSNNVTNNILINNFGKEDISYLDNEYFKNLIMNQHIEKGYVQLIKDIYLNKDHPENSTVKVENINNKYAHVYNNGKWDAILKADLKEELHKKNYTILKMHYDKLKKSMSIPKREETYTFLKRDDFSDPHMMYVIDKIILLFYNDGDDENLLGTCKINKNIV